MNDMSNEEFIIYFKKLSADDKIAAFCELFERFKNALKEREKVKSDYNKTVFVLETLKSLPGIAEVPKKSFMVNL